VKSTYGDYLPSADEVGSLTKAQLDAYNHLVDFGVKEGIAFRQMILKIKGSEANGFEDWYIQEAIKIFKTKTTLKSKNAQAGAFVKWYLEGKVFEEGSYFGQIMERISKQKKRLSAEQWRNRKTAMTINAEQFNALHSKTNIEKVQPKSKTKPKPIIKSKQGSQSLIDIIDLSSPEGKWSKPFNFKTFQKEFESDYEGIKTAAEQEMEDFFIDMERPANYNDILLNAIKIRCEHWYNQQQ
jgi:hypothetical protein